MYQPPGVKTSLDLPIPDRMKAWVLGDPDQLLLLEKPVPVPARAEVLIRIDAVAICATDLEFVDVGSERGDRTHVLVARSEILVKGQAAFNAGR